jgi:hypothetical protein
MKKNKKRACRFNWPSMSAKRGKKLLQMRIRKKRKTKSKKSQRKKLVKLLI